ncbi:ribosome maturation factor RimP [Mumia flava]|uniref:Ribosome maturation factor RimP n=1 Tax=Mumia flava TaxID=1348852 RepID=A0A0B2BLU3_9ACTN|nr:ribosome maturation factor RimP [Mumia flava]PJJ56277.1 ribosome maturation factor RimP [Mumia flava]
MASTPLPDDLQAVLDGVVGSFGLDLDAVELSASRVLRVVVDADGGVSLDDLAEVTRAVSAKLDETDVMGESRYTLEVTSRGVSRPLTLPRHWSRNAGRLVKVRLTDGTEVSGRIDGSDDAGAQIATEDGQRRIAYDDVKKAKIEPELKRKDT